MIRKEHFDIALKKVSMANAILSIKELLRMDFMQIFQNINGVEELLKKDPADVYNKMDYRTKEIYRAEIKKISLKTKVSEIYIANKIIELCSRENIGKKQKHVGYYLISKGKYELINVLLGREKKILTHKQKAKLYVLTIWGSSIIIDILICTIIYNKTNFAIALLLFLISIIPIQEIVGQIIRYILGKIIRPKPIPKIDIRKTRRK